MAALLSVAALHSSAAEVSEYAFTGDTTIRQPVLDGDVTAIGEGAFAGSSVERAVIPDGVTEIGAFAFADCRSLVSVSIPEGIAILPEGLFRGCTSLREVTLPSTLTAIEAEVFAATAIERIDLSGCVSLRTLGDRCFAGCKSLHLISLPEGVTGIGDAALFGCTTIPDIILPESVQHLGDCSLACLPTITTLRLPASLGYIGSNAMEGMNRLSGIDATWVNDIPSLGNDVWYGLQQSDIWLSVAPRLRDTFLSAPQWHEFNISAGTVSTVLPTTATSEIKNISVYRISEIEIIVTDYTDGSRRVEKILKTK